MSFYVTYVRHADGADPAVHRLRHYRGEEREVQVDCGKRFVPYDLFRLDENEWRRETACSGCDDHLLVLTDGENCIWREAPDEHGQPTGEFYIPAPPGESGEIPDELTPMAEIVRMWGIRNLG
ncbi:hypothetical protein [Amycolatopsis sp. CA-230715]|uniref:hypothetical protein n=1 Tax=Amycolatopsis sp. CA-230715 TaxID=2745196 RepID=UPI001C01C5DF|nr:hypothetical protein [Amycolatopsis sp. CA-230715]QWF85299.1 hypothetical protein HUW46_08753 [Amycolatopsis sp. CA-230715]